MGIYRIRADGTEKIWGARKGVVILEPSISLDGKTLAIAQADQPATYSWLPFEP